MFQRLPRQLAVIVLAVASVVAGCGLAGGGIHSESEAVAAARRVAHLADPVVVLHVEHGKAGDIFHGPLGAVPNEFVAKETAKRARLAWDVQLRGLVVAPCADQPALPPCGEQTFEVVLDEDTGEVLYAVSPG